MNEIDTRPHANAPDPSSAIAAVAAVVAEHPAPALPTGTLAKILEVLALCEASWTIARSIPGAGGVEWEVPLSPSTTLGGEATDFTNAMSQAEQAVAEFAAREVRKALSRGGTTWLVHWEIDVDPQDVQDARTAALDVWTKNFGRTTTPAFDECCCFTVVSPEGEVSRVDLSEDPDEQELFGD